MAKLSRDINGNKTFKVSGDEYRRGFSVQTLGNMPKTHRMTNDTLVLYIAMNELIKYVAAHGTKHQKNLLNIQ